MMSFDGSRDWYDRYIVYLRHRANVRSFTQPENLAGSGLVVVLTQTLFAIAGAVSLQQGADVASKVVRDRILR
jgi:hypothetical protein